VIISSQKLLFLFAIGIYAIHRVMAEGQSPGKDFQGNKDNIVQRILRNFLEGPEERTESPESG
jgi:hypothetical protein